jgi:hypothetical protein
MFFRDHNQDDAARAIDSLQTLISQQEYEFQRLIADLQLCVMGMADQVERCKITGDAAKELETGGANLKYDLREARHALGNAVDRMQSLLTMLRGLDMNDEDE